MKIHSMDQNGFHKEGMQNDGSVQLWTHRDGSDSMFMVLLRKNG